MSLLEGEIKDYTKQEDMYLMFRHVQVEGAIVQARADKRAYMEYPWGNGPRLYESAMARYNNVIRDNLERLKGIEMEQQRRRTQRLLLEAELRIETITLGMMEENDYE